MSFSFQKWFFSSDEYSLKAISQVVERLAIAGEVAAADLEQARQGVAALLVLHQHHAERARRRAGRRAAR